MAGGNVADYWASFTVKTDKTALARVDRYLSVLSQKLEKYQKQFNKRLGFEALFKVNEKQLIKTLGDALDKSSKSVAFEISKFVINDRNLQAALLRANRAINIPGGGYVSNGMLSPKEWDRRRDLSNKDREEERAFRKEMLQLQRQDRLDRTRETRSRRNNRYFDFGVPFPSTNHLMRFGMASIPFIGGAIGLSSLNQANQENMSTRLTTQAVMQSQGFSEQQGKQSFEWLRNLANQNGFRYMDVAPDYNQFMANSLSAGLDISKSQDIFKGFNEYGTAMGISSARRKLVTNAMSQMLGLGKVQMQELRQQMAESMPGTIEAFSQAYAQLTGSGLSGQKATQALYEAMGKGKVNSAEIMPIVAKILSQKAQPKLGILRGTSIAEQGRMGNAMDDLVDTFSNAGGESGFARFFRTMTTALKESDGLVKSMARGFNEISKYAEVLISLPQSISRMFDGRDSWVKDFLLRSGVGTEKLNSLINSIDSLSTSVKTTLSNMKDAWLGIWEEMYKGQFFPMMIGDLERFSTLLGTVLQSLNSLSENGLVKTIQSISKGLGTHVKNQVGEIAMRMALHNFDNEKEAANDPRNGWGKTWDFTKWLLMPSLSNDPSFMGLPLPKSPQQDINLPPALQYEKPAPESALPSNGVPEASNNKTIDVQVKAQIDVSGAQNPEEVSKMLDDKLTSTWRDALLQFGNYT